MTLDFSISARGKPLNLPVAAFLQFFYRDIPVRSVFGFREAVPLYGGRRFKEPELSEADIAWMYDHGIGYRIPLQTTLADRADYEEAKPFLARYHRPGNSVIVVQRRLAQWVREDFPQYEIEASVINRIRSVEGIAKYLKHYDVVVLHPSLNDRPDQLATIPDKGRIRLFANAGCMYRCPTMECYASFSRMNRGDAGAEFKCAQQHLPEYKAHMDEATGMTEFDVAALTRLGFTRFKKLRSKGRTGW